MRKELLSSLLAVAIFTVLLGLVYPLVVTGIGQVAFHGSANGSMLERDGRTVGSRLIAQAFTRDGKPDPRYFQPRPSQTDYNPAGTAFNNAGPNNSATRDLIATNAAAYLKLERPYNRGLRPRDLPVDAVTGSASGVDPHISQRNASIQARRIAVVRGIAPQTLDRLIDENTDGRFLAVFGEPGVNVLELNLALDKESSR